LPRRLANKVHGFLKIAGELLILQNETAKSAKGAKFLIFLAISAVLAVQNSCLTLI
jgi:hypothetical protein